MTIQPTQHARRLLRRRRPLGLVAAAGTLAALTVGLPGQASAADLPSNCSAQGSLVTCTYSAMGAEQFFAVPDGVQSVDVNLSGASGGAGGTGPNAGGAGGAGALVVGTIAVSSGQTLGVYAGSRGTDGVHDGGAGGGFGLGRGGGGGDRGDDDYYSGGGGGGASAIVDGASPLAVAGGGGGGGGGAFEGPGSPGGASGTNAVNSPSGYGQAGASSTSDGQQGEYAGGFEGGGGGGGGGGYVGGGQGGGGGAAGDPSAAGTGGGGGTDLAPTGGSATDGVTTGDGQVTISYTGQAPTISGTPPSGGVGEPYSYTFQTTGTPPPTESVTAGSLPSGLTLSPSGTLAGTPTKSGTYHFTVTASNGIAPDATDAVTMTIRGVPSMAIGDANTTEGNSGTKPLSFPVTLSRTSTVPVTVQWATANGSATAPSDYRAASGTLTIPAGTRVSHITVQVVGDRTRESNEVFYVLLHNPTHARISDPNASGGILNDD